ncbi:hypothetical protein GGI04_003202 [Coemansia thaxteri]|nr:hypothetical protein GGI04_003202 [Coemansia thaxteri]KAJ2469963.1 hypothetical protein GGI02_003258 [Coemansia sp. RSA 2322]
MSSSVYPAAVSHFAVFCPALGPDEDSTHEQLLYYAAAALPAFYPYSANDYFARGTHLRRRSSGSSSSAAVSTSGGATAKPERALSNGAAGEGGGERVVSLDTKLREIGLAAALVTFGATFGAREGSGAFHVVHSEKRRTVVFEPEPGVLMQLAVVLPRRVRAYGREKDAYAIEFLGGEISDEALRAWLAREYWAFRLLFGPLGRALRGDCHAVRRQLDAFFGRTLWHWDRRWAARELDLIHALSPLPQLPVGCICLGGFEQLWRDLSAQPPAPGAAAPLVAMAVVLWRGREVLWSSSLLDPATDDRTSDRISDRISVLRALVAWSRAAYAPAFAVPQQQPQPRRAAGASAAAPASGASSVSSSMPAAASSWLWGWGARTAATAAPQADSARSGVGSDRESSSSDGGSSDGGSTRGGGGGGAGAGSGPAVAAAIVAGGISQALSRAVNALVEPRPPTPPDVDPVFAAAAPDADPVFSAPAPDADSEFAPTEAARPEPAAAGPQRRSRSTTVQGGVFWPIADAGRSHARAPSIMSTASVASVESTLLRDDTRVSARTWWPAILGGSLWGGGAGQLEPVAEPSDSSHDDAGPTAPSGTDMATAFVCTGEHAFPGLAGPARAADDAPAAGLERAMDERLPPAYEHGVGVDAERGVVLAPRGLPGMLYDSRLLRAVYSGDASPDRALFASPDSRAAACPTLVYKYGDMLLVALGSPPASPDSTPLRTVAARGGGAARRRGRVRASERTVENSVLSGEPRFSGSEALAIEDVVLRYAASLQPAVSRDANDVLAQRRSEAQLALRRRIPPFVFQERARCLTRSNWHSEDESLAMPSSRSFAGFYGRSFPESPDSRGGQSRVPPPGARVGNNGNRGGGEAANPAPLSANASRTLAVINAELANNRQRSHVAVCVRMQDKGWVAASSSFSSTSNGAAAAGSECYCVVDQPKATLADAQALLSKLSLRAADSAT